MNILVLTAYAPVLQRHGGAVLMFHNIRILAQEHSVRVISFIENAATKPVASPQLSSFVYSITDKHNPKMAQVPRPNMRSSYFLL